MKVLAVTAREVQEALRDAGLSGLASEFCEHLAQALTRTAAGLPIVRKRLRRSPAIRPAQILRRRLAPLIAAADSDGGMLDESMRFGQITIDLDWLISFLTPAPRPLTPWHTVALTIATHLRIALWRGLETPMPRKTIGLNNHSPLVAFVAWALVRIGCLSDDPDVDHLAAVGKVLRQNLGSPKDRRHDFLRNEIRRRAEARKRPAASLD